MNIENIKNQIESFKKSSGNVLEAFATDINNIKKNLSIEQREKVDRWMVRVKDAAKNGTTPPPPLKF